MTLVECRTYLGVCTIVVASSSSFSSGKEVSDGRVLFNNGPELHRDAE